MKVEELTDLIESYGNNVYGFCFKLTKDKHQADDLYQETFLKVTELRDSINSTQNPKGFLIAVAANIWKNQRRKLGWRYRIAKVISYDEEFDHISQIMETKTPELIIINNELHKLVDMALESLNDKLKIPLYMYYNAELSIEDIASALKIPTGTVKSRLYKARKLVKKYMEVNGYEGF